MKRRLDAPKGRARYAQRFGIVDGQWKLFCLVHNIEKLAHHGDAA